MCLITRTLFFNDPKSNKDIEHLVRVTLGDYRDTIEIPKDISSYVEKLDRHITRMLRLGEESFDGVNVGEDLINKLRTLYLFNTEEIQCFHGRDMYDLKEHQYIQGKLWDDIQYNLVTT